MSAQAVNSIRTAAVSDAAAKLRRAREVLRVEIAALEKLEAELDANFVAAVDQLVACRGRVIVSGIGKAGIVGQKFAASLSSTGTPSHFLHAAEAVHGDLGCVEASDVVVLFSYSGETQEVIRLLPSLRRQGAVLIAITSSCDNTLAQSVDFVVPIGRHSEACSLGLAPTSSTTLMLAVSDALAVVTSDARGFSRQQFADFHPAGSLGAQLAKVTDVMRPLSECRVASEERSVREVFVQISRPGRRSGAVMLVNQQGKLSGIFTDSDLARILERQSDRALDESVAHVMSRKFHTVSDSSRLPEAIWIIAEFKISELPVVDDQGFPVGMIDITDLVNVVGQTTHATRPEGMATIAKTDVLPLPEQIRGKEAGVPRILSLLKYRKES